MKQKLEQFKKSPLLKAIVAAILLLITYKLYIWIKTESTDNAYVEADMSIVSSEINGRVIKVLVFDNQPVKAGDIIAEIDDTDYVAGFQKALSAFEVAENELKVTQQKSDIQKIDIAKLEDKASIVTMNFDVADRECKRISKLVADKFSSQKLLDDAKLTLEEAKSDLVQHQLNLDSANKNLVLLEFQKLVDIANITSAAQAKVIAEHSLANTKICSPIDGIVANNGMKVGNFLRMGVPVVAVVPSKGLYIKANFKETQVTNFEASSNAIIEIDAVPGVEFKGRVRNISPASGSKFSLIPPDNATGNFTKVVQRIPVILDFEIPEDLASKIKAGMSVRVSVRK